MTLERRDRSFSVLEWLGRLVWRGARIQLNWDLLQEHLTRYTKWVVLQNTVLVTSSLSAIAAPIKSL